MNAGVLVEAGAAVVVDDLQDVVDRKEWLWEELERLMSNRAERDKMRENAKTVGNKQAALQIAEKLKTQN